MPWGRGAERRPWLGIAVRFVLAARHGWRAVLRVQRWPILYAQRPGTRRFCSRLGAQLSRSGPTALQFHALR